MEEVRKKCEALKRRPRRKFLLLVVRVCGPLVTQRIFFSANGVLFLNVSEYANVCSSHERRYSSTSKGEYKNLMDLKKTKKKTKRIWSPTHKLVQKSVFGYAKFQVPEHLHRLAEKLRRVKVMCERNVCARVCVCLCVLLRRVNKIVHLNGFA